MKKIIFIILSLIILLVGCTSENVGSLNNLESKAKEVKGKISELEGSLSKNSNNTTPNSNSEVKRDLARVISVTDGDTITVSLLSNSENGIGNKGKRLQIRFLGIDTPESKKKGVPIQPGAIEASNRVKQLLTGKKIYIEYEPNNTIDKFNRVLAYVFMDDILVQELLLKEGLGIVRYTNKNTRYYGRLKQAETEAKNKGIGIWGIKGYVENGKYNMSK
ncbi:MULTISPECIES: thermonuclease family protein [Bacillus cereus group]|uniref:thermonuclease family protein n=1 Tax=Bacillus cereus group TaxID=86661 RepID=UPI0005CDE14C|nr:MULTISPECIES: thermonuclease family protein [Bacillus cereus group]